MDAEALTFGPLRGMAKADRWLLLLSIAAGAAYLAPGGLQESPARIAVKALGVAPLALVAFRLLRGPDRLLLGGALGLSCLGDVLLALPGQHFVQGLIAFLVAHMTYIVLFVRNWPRPLRPGRGQLALAALAIAYSALLFTWLRPGLGDMAVPVALYSGALTLMAVTAIVAGFTKPIVVVGAILFVLSDSMIATDRFKTAVPLAGFLIWATYYVGQYCIAIGFLREKLGDDQARL